MHLLLVFVHFAPHTGTGDRQHGALPREPRRVERGQPARHRLWGGGGHCAREGQVGTRVETHGRGKTLAALRNVISPFSNLLFAAANDCRRQRGESPSPSLPPPLSPTPSPLLHPFIQHNIPYHTAGRGYRTQACRRFVSPTAVKQG